jgi:uncharacterized protein with beta-barrel porin domain
MPGYQDFYPRISGFRTPVKNRQRLSYIALLMASSAAASVATPAFAQCVVTTPPDGYSCSGTNTTTQAASGANPGVSTTPGFDVDTTASGGPALTIADTGGMLIYFDPNASALTGATSGLIATNSGTGATDITATGKISGTVNYGILAVNGIATFNPDGSLATVTGPAGTSLTINAASASGGLAGIDVSNTGTGATSVTATGDVTGTAATSTGILARGGPAGTDLSINAYNVSGGAYGVYTNNAGTGTTSVTVSGNASATTSNGDGISASNSPQGTDLTVSANNVSGGTYGITAANYGNGATNVSATGSVVATAASSDGIFAGNGSAATDLTVHANDVSGGLYGLLATNQGTGSTSVTDSGTVTAAGSTGEAIVAVNYATGTSLSVSANNASGGYYGIAAQNAGSGATSVTATGNVTGTADYGILAVNGTITTNPDGTVASIAGPGGTDLTVSAASVTGGVAGIFAENAGTGATSVTATGDVTGTASTGSGILVSGGSAGTDLSINANNVSGGAFGVYANNAGTGTTSVTVSGNVSAAASNGTGIAASDSLQGTDLTVSANNVSGGTYGINAENLGSGATNVSATGSVVATAADSDGIFAGNGSAATDLTVHASDVSGGLYGLLATNQGTGSTSVTDTGTVTAAGSTGEAIVAVNFATAADLSVSANNASGGYYGIAAENSGTGATNVTATGNVTGTANYGILAANGVITLNPDGTVAGVTGPAGTDLTVSAASVTGGVAGIFAYNTGTGATSVTTTGDVTGTASTGAGILVGGGSAGTDLSVNANNVSGGAYGVYAINDGTGATSITVSGNASAAASNGTGISASNSSQGTDFTVSANNVSGGAYGITALNYGSGATNVSVTGSVVATAASSDGIAAGNDTAATDLTVHANDVSGGAFGIYATNHGTGSTSVTDTGTVTATGSTGEAIFVINSATGTDLSVSANNASGGTYGIAAVNSGSGATNVSATGSVVATAAGSDGIIAGNDTTATDLTVHANDVSGGAFGIYALNTGTGTTSVTATGLVTGTAANSVGLYAMNGPAALNLTVNAADVSAGQFGLAVGNEGLGATVITDTGTVVATAANGEGISALNTSSATNLTVNANKASGGYDGIVAQNAGTGTTSVIATGNVTGTADYGILAVNGEITTNPDGTVASTAGPAGTDLTVSAASVTGGVAGIYAYNTGSGATSVTATGDVTGTSAISTGILVNGGPAGTDLSVNADNVSGGAYGITAENLGSGATNVNATGSVAATSANSIGIVAGNGNAATDLTVNANNVTGTSVGLYVANSGIGATSISTSGDVTGTGASSTGILAVNGANTTGLTVSVNSAGGGEQGIIAENGGTGSTSITVAGSVVATSADSSGISALNGPATANLTVNAADVSAGGFGLTVSNGGLGATVITDTGTVTTTAANGEGISAFNAASATDLTVNANNVSGGAYGILAVNHGTGATTVSAGGSVNGTAANGVGLLAANDSSGTDLTISANRASGAFEGISAENDGTGSTSVTATGLVTSTAADSVGISALNGPATANLTVNAADVDAGQFGMAVGNGGLGATVITDTGTVVATAANGEGISAFNASSATGLTVNANNASGGYDGIIVGNAGSGTTIVAATGTITGTAAYGILAVSGNLTTNPNGSIANITGSGGSGLTVNATTVSGAEAGIYAWNAGSGATSVTATGPVTATAADAFGILAYNDAVNTTDLTVSAKDASGGDAGVIALNAGTGSTRVTATGTVSGQSTNSYGIAALNGAAADNLTVSANNATGTADGLYVANNGTGATSISTSGDVTGTGAGGFGIMAIGGANTTGLTISANNASGVYSGIAIQNAGAGSTSITTSGDVEGGQAAILALTAVGNAINITNTGLLSNSSGHSSDLAVSTSGGQLTLFNNGTLTGTIAIDHGGVLLDDLVTNNGSWNSIGGVNVFAGGNSTLVNSAGGVIVGGTSAAQNEITSFTGLKTLSNSGTITMADGRAGDVVHTSGGATFASGSLLKVDIGGAGQSDVFAADGAVALAGGSNLVVTVAGTPVIGSRYTVLTATGGLSGTFNFTDVLTTAFLGFRDGYTPTSAYVEYAQFRALAAAGQTPNQIATANGIDSEPITNTLRVAALNLPDDASARGAFDQLSGEIHASAKTTMLEDSRLVRDAALGRLLSGQSKGLWGTYSGSWATNDGDGNAATLTRNASSFVLGLDASPVKGLTVGVLGGYAKSDARLPARSSTAKIDSYTVGAYAGADAGRVKLRFGGAYSWQNVDTNRSVAFAGFSDKLSAHYSASTAQAFGDIGYTIGSDRLNVEPFAQAAWMDVATDAFTETGGAAALTASKQSRELGVVTLGLRGVAGFSIAGAAARFHATAGWRQATGDRTPDASLSFASGSAAFDIAGAPIAKDSAMIDAGIDVAVTPRLRLNVGYTGQLASHTRDNGVKTGLSMAF